MSDESNNRLFNLEAERDALRHASQTGSSLEGILARISAEVTKQSAINKVSEKIAQVAAVKVPEIDAKANSRSWHDGQTFPLTPLESLYLLRGYAVKPSANVSEDMLKRFPCKLTMVDGYLSLG